MVSKDIYNCRVSRRFFFHVFPLLGLSGLVVLALRAQHLGVVKVPSSSNSFKKFEKIYNAEQNQVAALYVSNRGRTWKLCC